MVISLSNIVVKIAAKVGLQYHKVIQQDETEYTSMRWGKLCWDMAKHKDGRIFLQYGGKPVKFVAIIPSETSIFNFLKQKTKWSVNKEIGTKKRLFIFGYTTRPLSICTIKRPEEKIKTGRAKCRGLVEHLN